MTSRLPIGTSPSVRVLLVEDNPLDAELTQSRLASSIVDCEFVVVDNEADFRRQLATRAFDVIIADFSLPTFSGPEALEIASTFAPSTPFILVSGALGEDQALDLLRRGATDFVDKHRLDKLPLVVGRALAERAERRNRLAAERALHASETHHRLLIDALKDYVVVGLDANGHVRSCNAASATILGCEPQALIGRDAETLFTPPPGEDAIPTRLREAAARGSTVDERWVCTPGGELMFASIVTTAIRDADEAPIGYSKIIRDMTQARRTADALQAAQEEASRDLAQRKAAEEALREANRRKSEFLAILAHELRNPLAPIRAGLEAMRLTRNDASVLAGVREGMERQVRHMVRLIDDLLDLSRFDHGHIQLERRELDLVKVCRSALDASLPLIRERRHEISLDLPDRPLHVRADETRIAQVVSNLLNNAASYTEPGGRIALTLRRARDEAVVTVSDSGVGIPPEMQSRVFESFTRIKSSPGNPGNPGGLGIGLSICSQLVRMHDGTIEVESAGLGHGSTFTVRLPALQAEVHAEPERPVAATQTSFRILVADDNVDGAAAMSLMLQCLGHEVQMVNHGSEVQPAVAAFRPDVVLLDIGMPDMDGYEVCRRLRADPGDAPLLVAVTGWGQERDRRRSKEAGFDHHLVKPVGAAELEALFAQVDIPVQPQAARQPMAAL